MGRKHPRQRKHFFLYATCCLSFSIIAVGCIPVQQHYEGEGLFSQKPYEEKQLLLQAKTSFANGDYTTSIKQNRKILERFPKTHGDQALYDMGLIYLSPEYQYANYEISKQFFNQLIREYPDSVFKNQAKIWVSLLDQITANEKEIDIKNKKIALLENELNVEKKKITDLLNQMKRLKEIDLGIEEEKMEALPRKGQQGYE